MEEALVPGAAVEVEGCGAVWGEGGLGLCEEPLLFRFVQMPTLTGSLGSGLLQGDTW